MAKRILKITDMEFELPDGFKGNIGNALVLAGFQRQLAEKENCVNTDEYTNKISYQFMESKNDGKTWIPFIPEKLNSETSKWID